MNQDLCPQTYVLIDQTVKVSLRRGSLHLFDQDDLRQELTLHALEARHAYTGPAEAWIDHCHTVLTQTLRCIRAAHSPRRPHIQNIPLENLPAQPLDNPAAQELPFDDTLQRLLHRLQKSKYRCKNHQAGQALLQAALDPRVAELINQLPAYDQIFALMLAALSKDEILQETGLSDNAYTYRVRRIAATLKAAFPQLAKGRRRRRTQPIQTTVPTAPTPQTTAHTQPAAEAQPDTQSPSNQPEVSQAPAFTSHQPAAEAQPDTQSPSNKPEVSLNPQSPETQGAPPVPIPSAHPHPLPNVLTPVPSVPPTLCHRTQPATAPAIRRANPQRPPEPPRRRLGHFFQTVPVRSATPTSPPVPTSPPPRVGLIARTVALFARMWRR